MSGFGFGVLEVERWDASGNYQLSVSLVHEIVHTFAMPTLLAKLPPIPDKRAPLL